jgi:hypothetical protein
MDEKEGITIKFMGGPSDGREILSNTENLPDFFVTQQDSCDGKRSYDYKRIAETYLYEYIGESTDKRNKDEISDQ